MFKRFITTIAVIGTALQLAYAAYERISPLISNPEPPVDIACVVTDDVQVPEQTEVFSAQVEEDAQNEVEIGITEDDVCTEENAPCEAVSTEQPISTPVNPEPQPTSTAPVTETRPVTETSVQQTQAYTPAPTRSTPQPPSAQPTTSSATLLYDKLSNPKKIALGNNGEIYILDGLTMKGYKNGRVEVIASLPNDRERFAPYGLGEWEDILTFRPGNMVYMNGAVYVPGIMMDRYLPPKEYGSSMYLGKIHAVILKVTDHFEPLMVDTRYPFEASIGKHEYERLSLGDKKYTNALLSQDYSYRFAYAFAIPNLVKLNDNSMVTILQAAFCDSKLLTQHIYTDKLVGTLLDKLTDNPNNYAYNSTPALYRIYPDGRHEMLDECILPSGIAGATRPDNQKHLSEFIDTFNKYMETENDYLPDRDLIYAVPSSTSPEDTVIVTNGHFIWKYNFKDITYEEIAFCPGSDLPTADPQALIPTYSYTPTMPRYSPSLGILFLGKHGVWRLYQDKYWQDLNFKMPWIDKVADWQIDEKTRTIYYVTRDGKLYAQSFAHILPIVTENRSEGKTFKVIYDKNREEIWGVKGELGVYEENGQLYVPIDPVLYLLGVDIYESELQWLDNSTAQVPIGVRAYDLRTNIIVRASLLGDVIQKHMPIDDLLDAVYSVTGQRYTWYYDPPTNTLYINSTAGGLPLFQGR